MSSHITYSRKRSIQAHTHSVDSDHDLQANRSRKRPKVEVEVVQTPETRNGNGKWDNGPQDLSSPALNNRQNTHVGKESSTTVTPTPQRGIKMRNYQAQSLEYAQSLASTSPRERKEITSPKADTVSSRIARAASRSLTPNLAPARIPSEEVTGMQSVYPVATPVKKKTKTRDKESSSLKPVSRSTGRNDAHSDIESVHRANSPPAVGRPSTPLQTLSSPPPSAPHTPSPTHRAKPQITYLSRTPNRSALEVVTPNSSPSTSGRTPTLLANFDNVNFTVDSPGTPRRPAKDLSALFDFTPRHLKKNIEKTATGPSAGTGMAKRMLSRTESSSTSISTSNSNSFSSSSSSSPAKVKTSTTRSSITRTDTAIDLTSNHDVDDSPIPSAWPSPSQSMSRPTKGPTAAALSTRTYAGKSRSFLVALPTSHFAMGGESRLDASGERQDDLDDGFEGRESYTDLRTRWGVDYSDDPLPFGSGSPGKGKGKGKVDDVSIPDQPTLPNGMMNDLKSITELRSKGESRRFLDEVGYLFEGLDPSCSNGVKRGSALEVVTKLCDTDFARKIKAADILGRAWDALRAAGAGDGDKVLDPVLAFFAALAARDHRDLESLSQRTDLIFTLISVLSRSDRNTDPLSLVYAGVGDAAMKKHGIGKSEIVMLERLKSIIDDKSELFVNSPCISTRFMVSHTLSAVSPTHFTPELFQPISERLLPELALLPPRISAYKSGLSILPALSSPYDSESPSLEHVEQCLRLLDSYLLGQWGAGRDDGTRRGVLVETALTDRHGLTEGLVALCVACDILLRNDEYEDKREIARKCAETTYRVLVNVTNDNEEWGRLLISNEYALPAILRRVVVSQRRWSHTHVKKEEGDENSHRNEDAHSMDQLCLSLALLTNLVHAVDEAKDKIGEAAFDPQCPGKRSCITACQCPNRITGLECLVRVYIDQIKLEGDVDSEVDFLRGHLAVLLGLLMYDSAANQKTVLESLPGTSTRRKLEALIHTAKEFSLVFADFARRVEHTAQQASKEEDAIDGDASPRRGRNDVMDRQNGNDDVTRDVIVMLETLRDQYTRG